MGPNYDEWSCHLPVQDDHGNLRIQTHSMPRFPQEIACLKGIVTIIIWYSCLQSFYLRQWESFGHDDDHVSADLQICSIQWDAVLVVICPMGQDTYSSRMSWCCTYTQGGQKWHMLVSIYHMSRMSMFYWSHRILGYFFRLLAIHSLVPWPQDLFQWLVGPWWSLERPLRMWDPSQMAHKRGWS